MHPEGLQHPTLGSEDPKAVSPTPNNDSSLALPAPAELADLGTPSPTEEISATACQLGGDETDSRMPKLSNSDRFCQLTRQHATVPEMVANCGSSFGTNHG